MNPETESKRKFETLWHPCTFRNFTGYMLDVTDEIRLFLREFPYGHGTEGQVLVGPHRIVVERWFMAPGKTGNAPLHEAADAFTEHAVEYLESQARLYDRCAEAVRSKYGTPDGAATEEGEN